MASISKRIIHEVQDKHRLPIHLLKRVVCLRNREHVGTNGKEIIFVNPQDIKKDARTIFGKRLHEPGVVYGGRWDKCTSDFQNRYKINSLIEHFQNGKDWKETTYYKRKKRSIEAGISFRDCDTEQKLLNYLSRYDDIYQDMKNNGYKISSNITKTSDDGKPLTTAEFSEIGINIGRNGELIWQTKGQHRLGIAQILGIEEVPVQVRTRHKIWNNIRTEIRSTDSIEALSQQAQSVRDHPDIIRMLKNK